MDWVRAKLLLIAAFLCLDALLAWQVSRLTVPLLYLAGAPLQEAPTPLSRAAGVYLVGTLQAGGPAPASAPTLRVETVGADPRALALLGPRYRCATPTGAAESPYSDCRAPSGAELHQLGGALVFWTPAGRGPWTAVTARAAADRVVRTVDPVGVAFLAAESAGPPSPARTYLYVETYGGVPLFDGRWTVSVSAAGLSAARFWLRVLPSRGPALPVITAAQAVADAGAAYGADVQHPLLVRGPVLFGYYYPVQEPPAAPGGGPPGSRAWQLVPVWRVRLSSGACIFVNGYNGQPEETASNDPLTPMPC